VVVAPLAALALWGGSYMLDCFHVLEAPGVPIQFSFRTHAGELTVFADSYSIAAGMGSVHIWKPRVVDKSGKILAQLDSLEATGLSFLRGSDQIIRVRGRNLTGTLTRLKNGRFDLQDFLPQTTSSSSSFPYNVEIDRSRVDVIDLNGSKPWTRTVSAGQIKVVGLGQDWVASGTASVPDVGSIETRIQSVKDEGLLISGSTQSLELASVFSHIKETPDAERIRQLSQATCSSVVVRGPFRIFVPKGMDPNIETSVDATAKDLHFEKFAANRASFVGIVNTHGMTGSAEVTDGESLASFNGSVVWNGPVQAAGDVTASAPDSQSVPKWASTFLPKGSSFRNGAFHGWFSTKLPGQFHVSGDVEALSATTSNQRFDDLKVGIDVENDHVVLQVKRAMCANGPISGILTIDGKQKTIQGYATGQNLDLQDIGAQFGYRQVNGKASVAALFGGNLSHPDIQFETHGQGVATPIKDHTFSLGDFEAVGSYAHGALNLNQAYFNTAYGLIVAQGSFGNSGSLGLDVTGRGIRIAEYDPRLSGAANLRAKVTGSFKNPIAAGRIEASDLAYQSNSIQAAVANFKVDRKHAEITGLEAVRGTASVSGQGRVEFSSGRLSGTLAASDIQIADWFGDDFVGAVDLPNIVLSGKISNPIAIGRLQGTSLVTKSVKLDNLGANVRLDGDQIAILDMQVVGAGGALSGTGNYNFSRRDGEVSLIATNLDIDRLSLDRFLPRSNQPAVIGGKVSSQAHFSIVAGNLIDVTASGGLTGLAVNKTTFGNGTWQAAWTNHVLTGNMEVGETNKSFRLTDVLYSPDTEALSGALSVTNFEIGDIVDKALPYFPDISFDVRDSLSALHGQFNLACKFDGLASDPMVNVPDLRISGLRYHQEPVGDLVAKLELKDRKWTIDNVSVSNGPALIALKGTIDERGDMHIDASSDNRFDLSKLLKFFNCGPLLKVDRYQVGI